MQAWENFLNNQQKILGAETVNKWLRTLKIIDYDACNLYLEAKDSFQIAWFEEHIRGKLRKELLNNNHRQIKVHLRVSGQFVHESPIQKKKKSFSSSITQQKIKFSFDELDPAATLDRFVPGASHSLVFNFLCEWMGLDPKISQWKSSKELKATFNPLYLYGPKGVGKTHLLMGIAHIYKQRELPFIYARAETFTDHVVSAIRSGGMQEFRKIYRHVQALLIDDVHLFARRLATQEELFHTFNALHTAGCQIILSAHSPPNQLQDIEARLLSRFEWGIAFQLEKLDNKEMRKVVENRLEALQFPLKPHVIDFLISTFSHSNSLHRAIESLVLQSHLKSGSTSSLQLEIDDVKESLFKLIAEEQLHVLTPAHIVQTVAEFFGIRSEDILGKSQSQECCFPRQLAMHLCREQLQLPFLKIANYFSRDHSTVIASIKQIQKKIGAQDRETLGSVREILRLLDQKLT